MNSSDTSRAPYAIQVNDTLTPERVVPCTPECDDPSSYKQIDDEAFLGIATGHWSTNLFSSFNNLVPNALMVSLCPCVSLAQITSRLGLLPFNTALLLFGILCLLELLVLILTVVQFIAYRPAINIAFLVVAVLTHASLTTALWMLRKRIRSQFQISGSNMNDCMSVACCPCFSTAQMATHIKSYQPGSCSFGPVDTLPRYQ
ncbi:unnamed protein product [Peronospora destructor]|uniref:PLAC8 family protein n=1 Tax=Peronospora destructor TaxID=86335 RepID=A0AAV0USC3_9STRA|nr:unnamed protein product [Peronospora destructor]